MKQLPPSSGTRGSPFCRKNHCARCPRAPGAQKRGTEHWAKKINICENKLVIKHKVKITESKYRQLIFLTSTVLISLQKKSLICYNEIMKKNNNDIKSF